MKLFNTFTGAGSIGLIQIVGEIPSEDVAKIGQLAIQIIIGIITLWQLLRKKKGSI